MKTIIENLIKNKEELIKNYTKIKTDVPDYYDGYYRGRIDELRESITELKSILELKEFEDFHAII